MKDTVLYNNDDILFVFTPEQADTDKSGLILLKPNAVISEDESYEYIHYNEDFLSRLHYRLPAKTRKPERLMSYDQCLKLTDKILWGSLSFESDGIPYTYGVNHILMENRLIFHGGRGYKVNGLGKRATFSVIEDLGVARIGTHNYNQVVYTGILEEITDFDTKKKALLEIVSHVAPQHPYNDNMPDTTFMYELKIEFVSGKTHVFE